MSDWEVIDLEAQWELLELEDALSEKEAAVQIPHTNCSAAAVDEPKKVERKSEDQGLSSDEELLPAAAVDEQRAKRREAPAAEDDDEFAVPPPPIPEFVHKCPGCKLLWVQTDQSYCYKCTAVLSQRARIQNEKCCPISQNNWHCRDKSNCNKMPVQFR